MNKKMIIGIAIAAIIIPIVVYAISPYFTESTVYEDLPDDLAVTPPSSTRDNPAPIEPTGNNPAPIEPTGNNPAPIEPTRINPTPIEPTGNNPTPSTLDDLTIDNTTPPASLDDSTIDNTPPSSPHISLVDPTLDAPIDDSNDLQDKSLDVTPMSWSGNFIGVNDGIHHAEGDAYVLPKTDGSHLLRLQNFDSTNGPDVYVYLSTDLRASDFVSLGRIKANSGDQNYEIPLDTDFEKYNNVLIWCKQFSTLFGSSELTLDNNSL